MMNKVILTRNRVFIGVEKLKNRGYFNCKTTTFKSSLVSVSQSKEGNYLAIFLDSNEEGDYGKSRPFTPLLY